MKNARLAVNKRTALKMFWDAGYDSESRLLQANEIIEKLVQPSAGYWFADDVARAINENKGV